MLRSQPTPHRTLRLWLVVGMIGSAVAFLVGSIIQTQQMAHDHIERAAAREAALADAFQHALRDYVGESIRPELAQRIGEDEFIPEAMSTSFVARNVFDKVREEFPDLVTRSASAAPRNPVNQATPTEARLIDYFQQHPEAASWSGTEAIDDSGIGYYVQAVPRRMTQSCLECHGKPADASASLVQRYGDTAGFGHQLGDVSVEIAAIPVTAAHSQAQALMNRHIIFAGLTCGLFLLFFGALAYLYHVDRKRAEEGLRKLSQAASQMASSMVITDLEGVIEYVNPAFTENTGYQFDEVVGKNPRLLKSGEMSRATYEELWATLTAGETWRGEMHNRRKDGSLFWELATIAPVKDDRGVITHYVAVKEEISRRKIIERQLVDEARTDALTGLANRTGFCEHLERVLHGWQAGPTDTCAVIFLDFDRFKIINDSFGHDAGDELLMQIAARMVEGLEAEKHRTPCIDDAKVARFGGDEFVVAIQRGATVDQVTRVAESILERLAHPYYLGGRRVFLTASMGIRLADLGGGDTVADLLRDADTAMYESKMAGLGRFTIFDDAMRERVQRRMSLETDLRNAVAGDQMFLLYQPIVDLSDGRIESYEALIRWEHPEHGIISPAEFIPIAEETGLILGIGQWVLETACRQQAEWVRTMGHAAPKSVSVNLSRNQLNQPGLATLVQQTLEQTGLPAERLHLEVTESTVMDDVEQSVRVLSDLHEIGVKLDMDDFGTGHSSLACLHDLPFDVIKIDRSFVMGIDRNRDFAAMIHAVAGLAENLSIQVVAEGIESADHVALLQAIECHFGQGYLFSKPMPAEDVPDFRIQGDFLHANPNAA